MKQRFRDRCTVFDRFGPKPKTDGIRCQTKIRLKSLIYCQFFFTAKFVFVHILTAGFEIRAVRGRICVLILIIIFFYDRPPKYTHAKKHNIALYYASLDVCSFMRSRFFCNETLKGDSSRD